MNQREELSLGIKAMGVSVDDHQQGLLLVYLTLLHKWNKVYNLTSIREPRDMVSHHLLDSLSVLPFLWPGRWLDVGCGAGLPGLVLAIVRPEWQFTMLDSNSKKTSFVQQAVIEMGLMNVSVCCGRVEDYKPEVLFDGIVSRAFTELGDFLTVTRHLITKNGRWAAMKGIAEKELDSVSAGYKVDSVNSLLVPNLGAARSLVIVSQNRAIQYE